jgi:hypothetical protein
MTDQSEEKSGIDMGQLKADAQKPKKKRAPRQTKGPKQKKFCVSVDVKTTLFLEFDSKEAASISHDVDALLDSRYLVKKQSQVAELRFT